MLNLRGRHGWNEIMNQGCVLDTMSQDTVDQVNFCGLLLFQYFTVTSHTAEVGEGEWQCFVFL